jgi:DNA helicase-2/ATP-dependent DNA helicase PcrA
MSDNEEGQIVGQSIFETQMNNQCAYNEFAILYRTNAQSRSLEESLRRRNIPYKIYGGLSFYQRKEVKDLLAYFRLIINPRDEESLKRIINYPARGIGNTTIQKLIVCSRTNKVSIWECIENPFYHSRIGVNKGTLQKLNAFALMINSFKVQLKEDAFTLAESIAKSSALLKELDKDKTPEGVSRYENVQELLNAIKEFVEKNKKREEPTSLEYFMQDVALITDQDNDDKDNLNKVTMMTIHAAKGLEFPYVYIVGLEENLFPSQLAVHSREELEEERRLFYVALTRAEKKVQLSYATSRWRWGQLTDCEPSRFLQDINEDYLDWQYQTKRQFQSQTKPKQFKDNTRKNYNKQSQPKTKPIPKFNPTNLTKANAAMSKLGSQNSKNNHLQAGMRVNHERFGQGKILQIEGQSDNKKAIIFFDDIGQKTLLLKFAKLDIIA